MLQILWHSREFSVSQIQRCQFKSGGVMLKNQHQVIVSNVVLSIKDVYTILAEHHIPYANHL
jgi:hypothetical protein